MDIESLRKRIYNRLATELGTFVYNPSIGSRLHELTRAKNLSDVHELANGYIKDALRVEIEKGFILSISPIRIKSKTLNRIDLEVDVTANNQEIITLPLQVN